MDFLAPGMLYEITSTSVMTAVLGLGIGQPPLLAVWAVFGAQPFWRRWLTSLAAICLLYVALLAGMVVAGADHDELQMFSINLLMLPLVFLSAQLPLWLLRLGLGRGLVHEDADGGGQDGGMQFRMRDLLTAFGLVGAALGLARLAVLLHAMSEGDDPDLAPWLYAGLATTLFGVWSALLVLPCVWAAFLAGNRGWAAVAAYVLAAMGLGLLLGPIAGIGRELLWAVLTFHGGAFSVILIGCLLLRGWGYSLRSTEGVLAAPAPPSRQA